MRGLACLVCAFAVGCGGSGGGNGGGDGGGGGGGGGDMAMSGGSSVAIHGTIIGVGMSNAPLAGATVTITGTSTSATTAADGTYTLMASAGATIFLTASMSGYQSSQAGYVVPAAGGTVPNLQMISSANVQALSSALNPSLTIDPSKGAVVTEFLDQSSTTGYGATVSASHGMSFEPDTRMYATTTTSAQIDQTLVFPNVVTGTTTVAANPPTGKTCTPDQAITNWRVDAGVFTWVVFNCQ